MRMAFAILALWLASPARAADPPKAVATAAKTEVSIGERFTVDVQATGPPGSAFTFPAEAVQQGFELRSAPAGPTPIPAGGHRYRAAVFALGEVQVPPIPVQYRLADGTTGAVQTQPIPLRVISLLPKDREEQKLADVHAPVAIPVGRLFWIAWIAMLGLVAGLVWWLVSRRRAEAPAVAAPIPVLEPDEEARRALEALAASGRLARGEYRLFYIDLTAIAKRYLERRLEAPIVEMTTAEMLSHVRAAPGGADLAPTLRDLAGAADQIKFARGRALAEEAERHLAAARAMVETLESRLRPAAPASGQAA